MPPTGCLPIPSSFRVSSSRVPPPPALGPRPTCHVFTTCHIGRIPSRSGQVDLDVRSLQRYTPSKNARSLSVPNPRRSSQHAPNLPAWNAFPTAFSEGDEFPRARLWFPIGYQSVPRVPQKDLVEGLRTARWPFPGGAWDWELHSPERPGQGHLLDGSI